MVSAVSRSVDRISDDERGSGRLSLPTCAQCFQFLDGICNLKAIADWGDSSKASPTRPACHFAELFPF